MHLYVHHSVYGSGGGTLAAASCRVIMHRTSSLAMAGTRSSTYTPPKP